MFMPNTSGLTNPTTCTNSEPGDRRIGGGEHEGHELVVGDIDAERARRVLAAGERHQRAAEARSADAAWRSPCTEPTISARSTSCARSDAALEVADAERRNARNAHIALGDRLPLHGDLVDDQADRERSHGEVVALEPQRRIADQPARRTSAAQCRRRAPASGAPSIGGGQHRRRVAADRSESVLAERRLSGIAHEDVEAGDEHRVDQREAGDRDKIAADNEGIAEQRRPRRQSGAPAKQRAQPLKRR